MGQMDEKKQKNRAKFISSELQLPQIAVGGVARIELSGNREAIIEGCKGILEYSDESISLNIGKNSVRFVGSDLIIRNYFQEQVIIEGNILTIDFS